MIVLAFGKRSDRQGLPERAPPGCDENQLCAGQALEVDLRWPASRNVNALGARLILHTGDGILSRDVHASAGYASGDPARVHFGFPAGSRLERLEIRWPDGATSSVSEPGPGTVLTVTRRSQ